jgi:hypothetical protein
VFGGITFAQKGKKSIRNLNISQKSTGIKAQSHKINGASISTKII